MWGIDEAALQFEGQADVYLRAGDMVLFRGDKLHGGKGGHAHDSIRGFASVIQDDWMFPINSTDLESTPNQPAPMLTAVVDLDAHVVSSMAETCAAACPVDSARLRRLDQLLMILGMTSPLPPPRTTVLVVDVMDDELLDWCLVAVARPSWTLTLIAGDAQHARMEETVQQLSGFFSNVTVLEGPFAPTFRGDPSSNDFTVEHGNRRLPRYDFVVVGDGACVKQVVLRPAC